MGNGHLCGKESLCGKAGRKKVSKVTGEAERWKEIKGQEADTDI